MSDMNRPGHEDGIQGDEPQPVGDEAAVPDEHDDDEERPGLGRTPMPPD